MTQSAATRKQPDTSTQAFTGINPKNPRKDLHQKTAIITQENQLLSCETDHGQRPINVVELFHRIESLRRNFPALQRRVPALKTRRPNSVMVDFFQEKHLPELLITNCADANICIETRSRVQGWKIFNLDHVESEIKKSIDDGMIPLLTPYNGTGHLTFV